MQSHLVGKTEIGVQGFQSRRHPGEHARLSCEMSEGLNPRGEAEIDQKLQKWGPDGIRLTCPFSNSPSDKNENPFEEQNINQNF